MAIELDASIKKIDTAPIKLDKDGDVAKEPTGSITLEIPLDTAGARESYIQIFRSLLREEFTKVQLTSSQLVLDESTGRPMAAEETV